MTGLDTRIAVFKNSDHYQIWTRLIDKRTGECIGKGQSVKLYDTVSQAQYDIKDFEFENENYKQEIVAIANYNPFVNEGDEICI